MVADQVVGQEASVGGAGSLRILGATVEEMRATRRRAEQAEGKLARAGQHRRVYRVAWQRAELRNQEQQAAIRALRYHIGTLWVWVLAGWGTAGLLGVVTIIVTLSLFRALGG